MENVCNEKKIQTVAADQSSLNGEGFASKTNRTYLTETRAHLRSCEIILNRNCNSCKVKDEEVLDKKRVMSIQPTPQLISVIIYTENRLACRCFVTLWRFRSFVFTETEYLSARDGLHKDNYSIILPSATTEQ